MERVEELVLESLEQELGGVEVYRSALKCAVNSSLKKEWEKYLEETTTHVETLEEVCKALGLDPKEETTGRSICRHIGRALVEAMQQALDGGDKVAAELVACECVVLAETKDHLNWELMARCAEHLTGPQATALKRASEKIEVQEDRHLYHNKGWCRELWIQSLGMNPVLPPPEESRHVKSAIAAAEAEQSADKMRDRPHAEKSHSSHK